jgi:hypothetical protein
MGSGPDRARCQLVSVTLVMLMTVRRAREWRVVLAVLACTGGACGRSGGERVAADSVPSAAAADTAAGLAPAPGESPLAAYPGFGRERDPDRARYQRQQIALHRYIAHCMQQAGFQYTPVSSVVNAPAPPDPNKPYVASLSPERRTRYNLTLYGVPDPNDESNLWDPSSPTGGGCWGEGMRAIPSVYKAKSELMTQYHAMQRAIARDPRVRAGEQRWSECMRSRGFSYARPQSIHAGQDSGAIRGALTPELQRQYREAMEVSPECATAVRLDSIKAAVRIDKEADFVRAHKAVLDRHVERLRNQQPLVDSLLAQPSQHN